MAFNVSNQEAFTWNLYKEIALRSKEENLIFSPFSIYLGLAIIQLGAKSNTDKQLQNILGLINSPDQNSFHQELHNILSQINDTSALNLHFTEKLYLEKTATISKKFKEQMKNFYSTLVHQINFKESKSKICQEINDWIKKETNSKITHLLSTDMLDEDTFLILVTTMYMSAEWTSKFSSKRNIPHPFQLNDGSKILVEMMEQTETFKFLHSQQRGLSILELPYSGKQISMYIILPDVTNNLKTVEKTFTTEELFQLMGSMQTANVCVKLPKFSWESTTSFKDYLINMGLTDLFLQEKANLSGISDSLPLFISSIVHKAIINVHEDGTEATSASAVIARKNRSIRDIVEFTADRPFIYLIRDTESKIILFAGRLAFLPVFRDKSEL